MKNLVRKLAILYKKAGKTQSKKSLPGTGHEKVETRKCPAVSLPKPPAWAIAIIVKNAF
jgi:hypothetical protein